MKTRWDEIGETLRTPRKPQKSWHYRPQLTPWQHIFMPFLGSWILKLCFVCCLFIDFVEKGG